MAYEVTGTVKRVFSKPVKNGKFTLWSFQLVDDDTYYGTKFDDPKLEEGDSIKFLVTTEEYNGKERPVVSKDSIKRVKVDKPAAKPAAAGGAGAQGRDSYWANKEERDIHKDTFLSLQGCVTNAVSLVNVALQHGLLPKVEKAAAGKKFDLFVEQVHEVAQQLLARQEKHVAIRHGLEVADEAALDAAEDDEENWDNEE